MDEQEKGTGTPWATLIESFNFHPQGVDESGLFPAGRGGAIWIAWERQRRTLELSRTLGIELFRLIFQGFGPLRYPILALHTMALLFRHRPRVLIIQNPSLILAAFAVVFKWFFRFDLVVDRHTNFMLNSPDSLEKKVYTSISDFTLGGADLTIVTNLFLANYVESRKGRSFVLPDPLPNLAVDAPYPVSGRQNVCFICTFASDEPFEEVIMATRSLPEDVTMYITGRYRPEHLTPEARAAVDAMPNLVMTGFLPEDEYTGLLEAVDLVVDLTTLDHCLVCGAYEGISLGKALLLSDKEANRELFGDVPVYVENTVDGILAGLESALGDIEARAEVVVKLREDYEAAWSRSFEDLGHRLTGKRG